MADRRNTRVITECGCVVLPDAVAVIMDSMGRLTATCDTHGHQSVIRVATFRETAAAVYGIIIPATDPDQPLF